MWCFLNTHCSTWKRWWIICVSFCHISIWLCVCLTSSSFRSLRFACTLLPPPHLYAASPLNASVPPTQLWIHWKRLSIMPWSDYLVVRLLTHSHHYITEGSLWNYSAVHHSPLHGPYTVNDRLHVGVSHPVQNIGSLAGCAHTPQNKTRKICRYRGRRTDRESEATFGL